MCSWIYYSEWVFLPLDFPPISLNRFTTTVNPLHTLCEYFPVSMLKINNWIEPFSSHSVQGSLLWNNLKHIENIIRTCLKFAGRKCNWCGNWRNLKSNHEFRGLGTPPPPVFSWSTICQYNRHSFSFQLPFSNTLGYFIFPVWSALFSWVSTAVHWAKKSWQNLHSRQYASHVFPWIGRFFLFLTKAAFSLGSFPSSKRS